MVDLPGWGGGGRPWIYTAWLHRAALVAGLVTGLVTGIAMLYQTPQLAPDGKVLRAHFGGSSWRLDHLGLDTTVSVYVGLPALAANLAVAGAGTLALHGLKVAAGPDATASHDYTADEGDPKLRRMTELVDGVRAGGAHALSGSRRYPNEFDRPAS